MKLGVLLGENVGVDVADKLNDELAQLVGVANAGIVGSALGVALGAFTQVKTQLSQAIPQLPDEDLLQLMKTTRVKLD